MSGCTRWSDIRAEVVERAGKQELRAEIRRARGLTRQQPAPHTTAARRRRLTRDRAALVRASLLHAMARHGWDIPEEDLLRLARDRSANVRFWPANLPGSTRPVYEILAEDPDDRIAVSARQWLRKPPRRGGFPNPAQLGRPITTVENHIWTQYMNRGQGRVHT